MRNTFCEMVLRTIQARGISRRDLCYGLCSESTFARYLHGERYMDRLLMTVLMQRLGESPDKFVTLLTEDEYVYFEWRQQVAVAQLHRDWEEVALLLQKPAAQDISCNRIIQRQFYLLLSGIVQEKCFGNRKESLKLLEKALSLTVPKFQTRLHVGVRLGVQEINTLLLWQNLQPDAERSYEILKFLVEYINACYVDTQEKCKIYPKAVAAYLPLLNQRGQYGECMVLAQKAIQLMTVTGYVTGMEEILQAYVEAIRRLRMPEAAEAERQLWAWREIWREYIGDRENPADSLYLLNMWQEIELLHEVISRSRKEKGYTQEELSENICEPETLSRIESGKRTPYRKTYQALAKRLALPGEYYYSTIETDRFEILELRWEYEILVVGRQWQKAHELAGRLEQCLDMTIPCNRQYVEQARYVLARGTGRIRAEESFGCIAEILGYSMGNMPRSEEVSTWPESFWQHSFTEREMSLLLLLADSLQAKKKYRQAICLLEGMLRHYQKSKVKPEFHYRIVNLIYGRLTVQYGLLGLWDKELEYSELGIHMAMSCGNNKMLPFFLNNKADALEHSGKKEAALKYYEIAFLSAKLLKANTEAVAKRSFEKLKDSGL